MRSILGVITALGAAASIHASPSFTTGPERFGSTSGLERDGMQKDVARPDRTRVEFGANELPEPAVKTALLGGMSRSARGRDVSDPERTEVLSGFADTAPARSIGVQTTRASTTWHEPAARSVGRTPLDTGRMLAVDLLCIATGLALVIGTRRLRLELAARERRLQQEARAAERERVARELHDTLLQGVQGMVLRFQSILDELDDGALRRRMAEALDVADDVLIESRDRIVDLRSVGAAAELGADLIGHARALPRTAAMAFDLDVRGDSTSLVDRVRREVSDIAHEAIRNAVSHARAERLSIEVAFEVDALAVRIRDDGVGMSASLLADGREGHWGLVGMRERATHVGAQLTIWSEPGIGTEIGIIVPALTAYARPRVRSRSMKNRLFPPSDVWEARKPASRPETRRLDHLSSQS